jgi:hypothetical protein
MRGVCGAAADAENEEPAAARADTHEFLDAFLAIVGIVAREDFGGLLEGWGGRGGPADSVVRRGCGGFLSDTLVWGMRFSVHAI